MYTQYRMIDAKHLATVSMPAIMEVFSCTSNSVCVFIVFAIYPKLLNFTLLPCLFHRNIHPPLYFQTIPPWPLPRPSSPLRRRRLSSRLARRVVPERRDHLATNLAGLLRIAHPLTPTSVQATPPLLLRTRHSMAKLTPIDTKCHHGPHSLAEYPLNGNLPDVKCLPQRSISFDTYCRSCTPSTESIDAKHWQPRRCQQSWKYFPVLRIQSVYSLFLQYTPNY